jgi:hypothetical protein
MSPITKNKVKNDEAIIWVYLMRLMIGEIQDTKTISHK